MVKPLLERLHTKITATLRAARRNPREVNEVLLVGGMTRLPCVQTVVREIFGRGGSQRVHTDESVAVGAAVLGRQLQLGSRSVLLVVDVTPHDISMTGLEAVPTRVIHANTAIPVERTFQFTLKDEQSAIRIALRQEPGVFVGRPLGELTLDDIIPKPRSGAQVTVTLSLDANGVLDVTASNETQGSTKTVRLLPKSGLDTSEVERLYREAEQERLIQAGFRH